MPSLTNSAATTPLVGGRGASSSEVSEYSYDDCTTLTGGTTSSLKLRSTVSFSKRVKAKKILRLQDYTRDEKDNCWYSREELQEIKVENHRIIKQIKEQGVIVGGPTNHQQQQDQKNVVVNEEEEDEDVICQRGLELILYSKTVEEVRVLSRVAILQEQATATVTTTAANKKNSTNHKDIVQERIAAAYAQVAKPSALAARARARRDEQDIAEYNNNISNNGDDKDKLQLGEEDVCANRATMLLARRRAKMQQRMEQKSMRVAGIAA